MDTETEYGTIAERVARGVQVLAEHGYSPADIDADRFDIDSGYNCVLGQLWEIEQSCAPVGWPGGYQRMRDAWSGLSDFPGIEWARRNGFSVFGDQEWVTEAMQDEWLYA